MNRLTISLLLAWTIASVPAVASTTNQTFKVERQIVNEGEDVTITCDRLISDSDRRSLNWKWQKTSELTAEYIAFGGSQSPSIGFEINPLKGGSVRHVSKLVWENISKNASGIYSCYESDNESPLRLVHLTVLTRPPDLTRPGVTLSGRLATGENLTLTSEVVESGRRFKLFCDFAGSNAKCGENKQIEWYFPPDKEVYHDEELYYQSRNVTPLRLRQTQQCRNVSGKNQWVLQVSNASYLDTGLYTCVDKTDNRTLSRHYVFVRDTANLVLPTSSSIKKINGSEHGFFVAYFSQRANILLGCGPTNPLKTVRLLNYGRTSTTGWADIVIEGSLDWRAETKAGSFRFNPLRGFEVNTETIQWDHEATYSCSSPHVSLSTKSLEQKFNIKVVGVQVFESRSKKHGVSEVVVNTEKLNLTCVAKTLGASPMLKWYWRPHLSSSSANNYRELTSNSLEDWQCSYDGPGKFYDENYNTEFHFSRIICNETTTQASGIFICKDENDPKAPLGEYNLTVTGRLKPSIKNEAVIEKHDVNLSGDLELFCEEEGARPKPKATWYVINDKKEDDDKQMETIVGHPNTPYSVEAFGNFTKLKIKSVTKSAQYVCRFENSIGRAEKRFAVRIRYALNAGEKAAIAMASLVAMAIAVFAIVFKVFYRRRKVNEYELRNLVQLLEGNAERIDREVSLGEQIELLPYDPKWEFPQESLVLGKQIGSGQYGRVVKAKAIGFLLPDTSEIEVAVKMVKSRVNFDQLKSLVGELKVLAHLSSHLNVVNLIGAVTKNIEKGNLMVIVEYCRNGNLKDFLVDNRSHFIDLTDDTGYMIPLESNGHNGQAQAAQAANGQSKLAIKQLYVHNGEKRSGTITKNDLIEWSYQIASGMNYLTQKKVIHGDLAARNILLADDNVVKIADFGLARKLYQYDNYQKKGNEALPVRWMAIESVKDHVFSSKSDVWSFGIVLWELFSLGEVPYAGIETRQLLCSLMEGQRLSKPPLAPATIGDVMAKCWNARPDDRPSFEQCEQTIGGLLDPEVLEQYKIPYDQYGYISMINTRLDREATSAGEPRNSPRYYEPASCVFYSNVPSALGNVNNDYIEFINDESVQTETTLDI